MNETGSRCTTDHPKYKEMIATAVQAYKTRGGSSHRAILKYITSYYNLGENITAVKCRLKQALIAGVKDGSLIRTRGLGANGSFRVNHNWVPKKRGKKVQARKESDERKLSQADDQAESFIQTQSSIHLNKRSKQKKEGRTVQTSKQTETNQQLQVDMSQTTNDPQNMLAQLIPSTNIHVKEQAISKAAVLTNVNLPKGISPHDTSQMIKLTDNGKVLDASNKNVSSLKSLKNTDALPSPIIESGTGAHTKSCDPSTKNVSSPKSFKNPDDIPSPITASEEVAHKKNATLRTKISLEEKIKLRIIETNKQLSDPVINCTHPIIPQATRIYRNCKLCAAKGIQKKSHNKCYACNTYFCFNLKRNCLLDFHKIY